MSENLKPIKLTMLAGMLAIASSGYAQGQTVKGTVRDASGEPVIGATVMEQGVTGNGTVTDLDGNFTLDLKGQSNKIQFSYVGMKPQTISYAGKELDVVLVDDAASLNDVVVIGYGTMKKKDLTGSVATVKGDALTRVPTSSLAETLTGKLSGVHVTTTDGSPDADILIRVHGGGSITGDNSPLYIIDGFPADNLNDISPNDIEDITVLKDASSTAIYGSRGANGVILVTTKNAQGGRTTVSYNAFLQTKRVANRLKSMNTYDYVMSNYEYALLRNNQSGFEKAFGVYDDLDIYKEVEATDWQDDMFGASVLTQQHNLSLQGGNDKTKFSLSGTYDYNGGLMPDNDFSRYAFLFKLQHELNKKVKVGLNVRVSDQNVMGSGTQGGTYKIRTSQAITSQATKGLTDYIDADMSQMSDEERDEYLRSNMTLAEQAARYWRKRQQRRFQFNGNIDWQIIKDLKAHFEAGYGMGFNETKNWWGATTTDASYAGGQPLAQWQKQNTRSLRESATLTYSHVWQKKHNLNVMIGQETNVSKSDYNQMRNTKYSSDWTAEQVFANFGLGEGTPVVNSVISPDDKLASFFGRVNYTYLDRYYLTVTAREDGSSKFGQGRKWGFFPAAAASWRIIEEPWMASTRNVLSNLKLRASYGEAGNNRISSSLYQMVYVANSGSKRYGVGEAANNHLSTSSNLANPNLTWETTITRNLGLDFGLFDEKISGTVELYWNSAKDLLIQHDITAPGYNKVYENTAETSNNGIDINLNFNLVNKKDFRLDGYFNINFNKSEVKDLANGLTEMNFQSGWAGTDNKNQNDYIVRVGDPIGLIYGWKSDGYYTTADFDGYDPSKRTYQLKDGVPTTSLLGGSIGIRPGTMKLQDLNGDGIVDNNDLTVIGDTNPSFSGGFGFSAEYKGFDLAANFTYTVGNDVYNANKIAASQRYRSGSWPNFLNDMRQGNSYSYLNRETGTLITSLEDLAYYNEGGNGQPAKEYWSPFSMGDAVVVPTDWAIEDASFLRLQSVTLGYTLPKNLTRKAGVQRLRLYVTASNLFTITSYSGYDPEVSSYARNSSYSGLTPGIDYSSYPKSRAWTFGLNLTL